MSTLVTTVLGILYLAIQQVQFAPPSADDAAWMERYAQAELERLMPIDMPVRNGVAFRSYQDLHYGMKERFFRIDFDYDSTPPRLRAVLVAPLIKSIQQQLLELHVADRTASIEDIRSRIKVDRREVRENRCPAIRKRVESLRRLRVALPNVNLVRIHPEIFRVVTDFNGAHVDAALLDSMQPLARWAVETYDNLRECAER